MIGQYSTRRRTVKTRAEHIEELRHVWLEHESPHDSFAAIIDYAIEHGMPALEDVDSRADIPKWRPTDLREIEVTTSDRTGEADVAITIHLTALHASTSYLTRDEALTLYHRLADYLISSRWKEQR